MRADYADLNVSRETSERLETFVALVEKWNPTINLVSKASVAEIWDRHIRDSIQVFQVAPEFGTWVDLGTGGGFPGMICAICAREMMPTAEFTMIESDQRKSAFLRQAAREADTPVTVLPQRVEQVAPRSADVLSARALAPLDQLLSYAERHMAENGVALFSKGATWKKEVAEARRRWNFNCEAITSETQPESAILRIQGVSRV